MFWQLTESKLTFGGQQKHFLSGSIKLFKRSLVERKVQNVIDGSTKLMDIFKT